MSVFGATQQNAKQHSEQDTSSALPSGWVLPKTMRDPHGMIVGQGKITYRVNAHWGRLDPNQTPVENCHGLDIDAKGRVVMITDDPRNNIVIYNRDGKLLDTFSTHMPGGHSVKIVNENGEDFMYLIAVSYTHLTLPTSDLV